MLGAGTTELGAWAGAGGSGATGLESTGFGLEEKCRKTGIKKEELSIFFIMGREGGTKIFTAFHNFILKRILLSLLILVNGDDSPTRGKPSSPQQQGS